MNTIIPIFRRILLVAAVSFFTAGCCLFGPKDVFHPPSVATPYKGDKLGEYISNSIYTSLMIDSELVYNDVSTLYFDKFAGEDDLINKVNSQLYRNLRRDETIVLSSSEAGATYLLKGTEFITNGKILVKLNLSRNNKASWRFNREFDPSR